MAAFDKASLQRALAAMRGRYGALLSSEEIEDIRSRIERLLEDRQFAGLIEGAKIYKERSLSYRGELKQIDLLLEYPDHYVVVDYKSSKKGMLKHQHQVASYIRAVQALTGRESRGVILYLEKEKIEYINLNLTEFK